MGLTSDLEGFILVQWWPQRFHQEFKQIAYCGVKTFIIKGLIQSLLYRKHLPKLVTNYLKEENSRTIPDSLMLVSFTAKNDHLFS